MKYWFSSLRALIRKHKNLCIAICLICTGYLYYLSGFGTHYEVIEDIAYDNSHRSDCLVYLQENGEYVPYLVLDSDYDGNVLLLRKHLLDEAKPFNDNGMDGWHAACYCSYYPESTIDDFLNTAFWNTLDDSVRKNMVESHIEVTDKSSYKSQNRNSIFIFRNVFLLSINELGRDDMYTSVLEGKQIKYFIDNYRRKIATGSEGIRKSYWTRTPELGEVCVVFGIGKDTRLGSTAASYYNGVRPAFCLKKGTRIKPSLKIEMFQKVYVVE